MFSFAVVKKKVRYENMIVEKRLHEYMSIVDQVDRVTHEETMIE